VRLVRLTARSFRNLAPLTREIPPAGMVLLGENGQGKTSVLEAIAYPVLFRSFRTVLDAEAVQFGDAGFHVGLDYERDGARRQVAVTFRALGRRKQIELDGAAAARILDAAGQWLAVVFAPEDVRLASGPANLRRLFLDRALSLADPAYLRSLARYRSALAQRNAALRQGRLALATVFDPPLAHAGAAVLARRLAWLEETREPYRAALIALGETGTEASLGYSGVAELTDPEAWKGRLAEAAPRDLARRTSTVGPHRDDLTLLLDGRSLRDYGSTGQHRSAAIALKLLELETIERATGTSPALLLDDVFAELDGERQARLARRLFADRAPQVFLTAPRAGELPAGLQLPVWRVAQGRIEGDT